MRLVIQRVSQAQVIVEGKICGSIQRGLLVLMGIHQDDQSKEVKWLIQKLIHLRIFADDQGKMNLSIKDIQGEVLVVSQFTLYGNCLNGRRPDFIQSAPPGIALPLYHQFIEELKQEIPVVQTGQFGAYMQVSLINDGPVTFILESPENLREKKP